MPEMAPGSFECFSLGRRRLEDVRRWGLQPVGTLALRSSREIYVQDPKSRVDLTFNFETIISLEDILAPPLACFRVCLTTDARFGNLLGIRRSPFFRRASPPSRLSKGNLCTIAEFIPFDKNMTGLKV
jgi:hypothetical protein